MTENNPLVSVIIPVYNGSNYVKDAIESALGQTYGNIEIIVINDGSNDDGRTDEICRSYGEKIVYRYKENGGVASALNAAIRLAKGEYISWLSHDDMYMRDKIEKQMNFLTEYKRQNSKECVLYSNCIIIDVVKGSKKKITLPLVAPNNFYESMILAENFSVHGCTPLVPRDAFNTIGYFNEKLRTTQDFDMWMRLNTIYDFIQMNDYFVESREHPDQGSKTMSEIHFLEKDETYKNYLKLFIENSDDEKFQILHFGKLVFSFKKRGYYNSYKYAVKVMKKHKVPLAGRDLLFLFYAFIYSNHLNRFKIYSVIDRILLHDKKTFTS